MEENKTSNVVWTVVTLGFIAVVLAAILFPMFARTSHPPRKPICMTRMRELGLAYSMYVNDYNGFTPTWRTNVGQKGNVVVKPSAKTFSELRGRIPPVIAASPPYADGDVLSTWPMRLYAYKKNAELVWCPSSIDQSINPKVRVSYVLKPTNDSNYWSTGPKMKPPYNDQDFMYPSEQVLFYEHSSFHWGGDPISPNGKEGASFNVCYFDSHVKTVRLRDPKIEPDYYNWNPETAMPTGKRQIDPRKYCDKLP